MTTSPSTPITSVKSINRSAFSKALKALVKYNQCNRERENLDSLDVTEKEYERLLNKHNRICENAFDVYSDKLNELPKYEQKRIETSEIY